MSTGKTTPPSRPGSRCIAPETERTEHSPLWPPPTAGVTARRDPGPTPPTTYCYKVRAFLTAASQPSYSDFSNTACATTLAPPLPPGLHVTGVTTGVDLDADGYWVDVWRS